DLHGDRLVGARRGEEVAVGADRRAHELAEIGDHTLTQRLDELIGGDLEPVRVLRADLVLTEDVCRGVGHARAGEHDRQRSRSDGALAALADAWHAPALPGDPYTRPFDSIRPCGLAWHQYPLRADATDRILGVASGL